MEVSTLEGLRVQAPLAGLGAAAIPTEVAFLVAALIFERLSRITMGLLLNI